MTFWQIDPDLSTDPPVVKTTAGAVLAIPFDVADLLGAGETATAPTATLTDLASGAVTRPPVEQSGTVLTVALQRLTAGHDYKLIWRIEISPTNMPTRITIVRCIG